MTGLAESPFARTKSSNVSEPVSYTHLDVYKRQDFTRKGADTKPFAVDGLRNAEWVAMDYSDILVHVFLPETREFYNLEHLWADAKLTQIPDLD